MPRIVPPTRGSATGETGRQRTTASGSTSTTKAKLGATTTTTSPISIDQLVRDSSLKRIRKAVEVDVVALQGAGGLKTPGVPYRHVRGGPVELFHGSIVEGSIDHKGLQPHYVVDLDDPRIAALRQAARGLRDEPLDFHERCAAVKDLVAGSLEGKKYDQPGYLALLQSARTARKNVTPGDYLHANAGVCREHAMLTHIALREAGVESRYLYLKAVSPDGTHAEDHAVALAFDKDAWQRYGKDGKRDVSEAWIVDAYNGVFDGRRVQSFLARGGSRPDDASRPDVVPDELPDNWLGFSVRLVDYPDYWVPIRASPTDYAAELKDLDVSTLDFTKVRIVKFDAHKKKWPPAWLNPFVR